MSYKLSFLLENHGLGTHNDKITPNTPQFILPICQNRPIFGIFLKKILITCPLSMYLYSWKLMLLPTIFDRLGWICSVTFPDVFLTQIRNVNVIRNHKVEGYNKFTYISDTGLHQCTNRKEISPEIPSFALPTEICYLPGM